MDSNLPFACLGLIHNKSQAKFSASRTNIIGNSNTVQVEFLIFSTKLYKEQVNLLSFHKMDFSLAVISDEEFVIKILVVDDQECMRKVISHILKQLGFEHISVAADGKIAFNMLRNGCFNFVISDWNMPNMSGIQLLKLIRKTDELKTLPVLLITAENEKSQVMEAAKAGVNSFIAKPFSAAQLEKKIDIIFPDRMT